MKKQLFLLTALLSLNTFTYAATTYTAEELTKIATDLNKDYPIMVDKITKLSKVTFDAPTFSYHYQLIDKSVADLDAKQFNDLMRDNLIKSVCDDKFAQRVFQSNYNISFDYVDKDNKPVANILFKTSDCPVKTETTKSTT